MLKALAVDVSPAPRRQHLERDTPAGLDLLILVDGAHPALAEQRHDAIRAENAARFTGVGRAARRVGAIARRIGQRDRLEVDRSPCVESGRFRGPVSKMSATVERARVASSWTVSRKPGGWSG